MGKNCGCTSKVKNSTVRMTNKKVGGMKPSVYGKKVMLLCKASGTTNPDDLQK